jgi:hypothetical protein
VVYTPDASAEKILFSYELELIGRVNYPAASCRASDFYVLAFVNKRGLI